MPLSSVIMERVYFESETGNALRAVRIMPEIATVVLDESCEPQEEVATSHTGRTTNTIFSVLLFINKKQTVGQINDPRLGRILFSFVPASNTLVLVLNP